MKKQSKKEKDLTEKELMEWSKKWNRKWFGVKK